MPQYLCCPSAPVVWGLLHWLHTASGDVLPEGSQSHQTNGCSCVLSLMLQLAEMHTVIFGHAGNLCYSNLSRHKCWRALREDCCCHVARCMALTHRVDYQSKLCWTEQICIPHSLYSTAPVFVHCISIIVSTLTCQQCMPRTICHTELPAPRILFHFQ